MARGVAPPPDARLAPGAAPWTSCAVRPGFCGLAACCLNIFVAPPRARAAPRCADGFLGFAVGAVMAHLAGRESRKAARCALPLDFTGGAAAAFLTAPVMWSSVPFGQTTRMVGLRTPAASA